MQVIAHRGASAYAPENTRAAFDLAIEMRADSIETDVQVTRDGELVLIHDDLVDRTTNGVGPVADFTMAELRSLDAGSWFEPRFQEERILTLAEYWATYTPRIPVCLEIKDPLATEPFLRFLEQQPDLAAVTVTSFSWSAVLRTVGAVDVPVGFLCKEFNDDIIRRCAERGLAQVCPHTGMLTADLVDRAHDAGLVVRAWGVRERADVDRLFATGADGATSNWPDWITDHPEYERKDAQ